MTDDIAVTAKWERLCELLDDDPELLPSVRLAVTDPDAYFRQRADELVDRGIESADDVDVWGAIIDGLDDAGALAYLDWKDTAGELADALRQVPRVFRAEIDLDKVADLEGELPAVIAQADGLLASRDLRIIYLDEDSDAYPLVAVPIGHVDEIVELSAQLGQVARVFP